MKYLSQIAIIMSVSFAGELMNMIIPMAIPGSLYGLLIMFILLKKGIIKVGQVKKTGEFLLSVMPLMFIGPVVSLMNSYDSFKEIVIPIFIISTVTTIVTMAVTGKCTEKIIGHKAEKEMRKSA